MQIADLSELIRYCYRVAGTVGLMMCRVLDVQDKAAFAHAIDLGIAMQLTNICRDVQEDATRGRRYLPASLVGDIKPVDLIDPSATLIPPLRQCLKTLLDLADNYYRSGENGLSYLPLGARACILVASRVYGAIGKHLRHHHMAYWHGRVSVSKQNKAILTAKALLITPLRSQFWYPQYPHQSTLHEALTTIPGVSLSRPCSHVTSH